VAGNLVLFRDIYTGVVANNVQTLAEFITADNRNHNDGEDIKNTTTACKREYTDMPLLRQPRPGITSMWENTFVQLPYGTKGKNVCFVGVLLGK
jgi:hypothetical protein